MSREIVNEIMFLSTVCIITACFPPVIESNLGLLRVVTWWTMTARGCKVTQCDTNVSKHGTAWLKRGKTQTVMGSSNWKFDRNFNGNLDWKFNKNFYGKGGIWRREMKLGDGKGKRDGANRNTEKRYKKGITIFLFTRAMPRYPS